MVFWTNRRTPQIEAVPHKMSATQSWHRHWASGFVRARPAFAFLPAGSDFFFKHCRGPMKRQPLAMPFQVLKKQPIEVPQWRGKASKKLPSRPSGFSSPKPPSDPVTHLEGVHFHQTQRSGAYQHHTSDLLGEVGPIYAMVKTAFDFSGHWSSHQMVVYLLTASPNMGLDNPTPDSTRHHVTLALDRFSSSPSQKRFYSATCQKNFKMAPTQISSYHRGLSTACRWRTHSAPAIHHHVVPTHCKGTCMIQVYTRNYTYIWTHVGPLHLSLDGFNTADSNTPTSRVTLIPFLVAISPRVVGFMWT